MSKRIAALLLLFPVLAGCYEMDEIDKKRYAKAEEICCDRGGVARFYGTAVACSDNYFVEFEPRQPAK